MELEKNLTSIHNQIAQVAHTCGRDPKDIGIVAVSKGRTVEEIKEAYFLGIRDFGENRVVEALEKMEQLPSDVRWHFIGKLQKNKVNKVIGRFTLIHSVDTVELAQKIARASLEKEVISMILLEANISGENAKSGLTPQEWEKHYHELTALKGIEIQGLMTMAPLTENEGVIHHCFSELRLLAERLNLPTLSMGMTHDFPLAIQEGATIVRIGTALFSP